MENENKNSGENLTEEHFERILSDLEGETPKVAKELYPDDLEEQENFTENIYKAAMLMGGGKDSDLVEKEGDLNTKQIKRILENPKEEGKRVAKELYPKDKAKQKDFLDYVLENFEA